VLDKRRAGDEIALHAFRRDELRVFRARLRASPRDTCVLSLKSPTAAAPLRRWLGA
jgi:predicted metalloprotease with PDZ domain